jgi:hypothetical protein
MSKMIFQSVFEEEYKKMIKFYINFLLASCSSIDKKLDDALDVVTFIYEYVKANPMDLACIYEDEKLLQLLANDMNKLFKTNPVDEDDSFYSRYRLAVSKKWIVDTDRIDKDGDELYVSEEDICSRYLHHIFIQEKNSNHTIAKEYLSTLSI